MQETHWKAQREMAEFTVMLRSQSGQWGLSNLSTMEIETLPHIYVHVFRLPVWKYCPTFISIQTTHSEILPPFVGFACLSKTSGI